MNVIAAGTILGQNWIAWAHDANQGFNADGTTGLPMPTVIIADAAGTIRWIDVHRDYTTRTEPGQILQAITQTIT